MNATESYDLDPDLDGERLEEYGTERASFTRRFFLTSVSLTGLGLLVGAGARLVGGFFSDSFRDRRSETSFKIGVAGQLEGSFKRFVLNVTERDFWKETTRRRILYARRGSDGRPFALSANCSHMGCAVRWEQEQEHFACPCHKGYFDPEGVVLSGPPPSALERLECWIEEGDVFVKLESQT